jgi:hypothetical protein
MMKGKTIQECFEEGGSKLPFEVKSHNTKRTHIIVSKNSAGRWVDLNGCLWSSIPAKWTLVSPAQQPAEKPTTTPVWTTLEDCFIQAGKRFPFTVHGRGYGPDETRQVIGGGTSCWKCSNGQTYRGDMREWRLADVPAADKEFQAEAAQSLKPCTCNIVSLMAFGCKCGGC